MSVLVEILERYGIEYRHKGKRLELCCPFHHDTEPSAAVYPEDDHFHCWACEITVDPIQFVQRYREISYQDARTMVETNFGYSPDSEKYDIVAVLRGQRMMERKLSELRGTVDFRKHATRGELADKIIWCVQNGKLNSDQFYKAVLKWKENLNG